MICFPWYDPNKKQQMAVPLVTLIATNAWAQISTVKENKTALQKYLKSTDKELWLTLLCLEEGNTIPPRSSDDLLSKTSANCSHTVQEKSEGKPA